MCVWWMLTGHKSTHNFWMRVSTAESTAWISAAEHVQTTGCLCTCSCSATYCNKANAQSKIKDRKQASNEFFVHGLDTRSRTCPCQSVPLTRIRLSGSAESDNRIWFSWSYTAFLRTFTQTHAEHINSPAVTNLLFRWLTSTYIIHFWAPGESYIIRRHAPFTPGKDTKGAGRRGHRTKATGFCFQSLNPTEENTATCRFIFVQNDVWLWGFMKRSWNAEFLIPIPVCCVPAPGISPSPSCWCVHSEVWTAVSPSWECCASAGACGLHPTCGSKGPYG